MSHCDSLFTYAQSLISASSYVAPSWTWASRTTAIKFLGVNFTFPEIREDHHHDEYIVIFSSFEEHVRDEWTTIFASSTASDTTTPQNRFGRIKSAQITARRKKAAFNLAGATKHSVSYTGGARMEKTQHLAT